MGVTGLWPILGPVKRHKSLSSLQGQTVAVDLSGWVCQNQAVRQLQNRVLKPHLRYPSTYLWYPSTSIFVCTGEPTSSTSVFVCTVAPASGTLQHRYLCVQGHLPTVPFNIRICVYRCTCLRYPSTLVFVCTGAPTSGTLQHRYLCVQVLPPQVPSNLIISTGVFRYIHLKYPKT